MLFRSELPDPIWTRVSMAWVVFFATCGALNLYVAYSFDTDTWVNFKLFGMLGLTVVFVISQTLVLMKFMKEPPEEPNAVEENANDG